MVGVCNGAYDADSALGVANDTNMLEINFLIKDAGLVSHLLIPVHYLQVTEAHFGSEGIP